MTSCPGDSADAPASRPVPLRLERRRPAPGQVTMRSPGNPLPATHLADLTMEERKEVVVAAGLPAFRAHQASQHYFERWAAGPHEMTNVPAAARETLAECLFPPILTLAKNVKADDGMTVKQVWRLHDGALVESVLMRYPKRVTMCISSQAGCGMNCPFCATGQEGFTRNLSTAEMVEQVVSGMRWLARGEAGAVDSPLRVSNVVFMGMGEALVNYKRAVAAIRRMVDPAPEGMGMSARGITMSTVGLVPGVQKLAGEGLPVTLALSLHAPDDDLRNELVPLNVRYPVAEVLDVAYEYFVRTKRRVSIEYALIKDINDQAWRADLLGQELNRRGKGWVHVNPIPLNPTPGSKWTASRPGVMQQFVERLVARGVPTTIRDTRGQDIDGACGQLAAKTA